ncbi:MAG: hypothetical protein IPM53_15440 [Anaerolineaceae bacterium]|nr:hypothetical protein [Anaerolineaceae bacterium]
MSEELRKREQLKERIEFSVSTASRHPHPANAYDPLAHRYKKNYIHPTRWWLHLEVGAMPLTESIIAYRWRVVQPDGEFEYQVAYNKKVSGIENEQVEVPAEGQYVIELDIELDDGRSLTARREFHLYDFLVVAIGDSYFCGEGKPDVPGQPSPVVGPLACNLATFTKFLVEKVHLNVPMKREPQWQEERVHRSYQSGPSQAAADLETLALGVVVTFLNFARSGATVYEGLLGPRPKDDWTDMGQVEEARRTVGDRPIDALLISIGGNDIEFPDRLLDLLRDDLALVGVGGMLGDDELNRKQEVSEAKKHLDMLPDRLDELAPEVDTLNAKQVYLMEYPIAHFDTINDEGDIVVSSGCGIFDAPDMDIDGRDAQVIKDSGEKLNHALRKAAQRHGWIMVGGITDAFAGHGRCSPDPYFISAEESCKIQGDFAGTMHPNRKGHKAYGECIEKAIYAYTIAPTIITKRS